jgi:hypothetical protein
LQNREFQGYFPKTEVLGKPSYIGTLSSLSQPLAKKAVDSHNASTISNITLSREQQQKLLVNFQQ